METKTFHEKPCFLDKFSCSKKKYIDPSSPKRYLTVFCWDTDVDIPRNRSFCERLSPGVGIFRENIPSGFPDSELLLRDVPGTVQEQVRT